MHRPWPVADNASVEVPTGYCEFPREMVRPPRSLASRTYTDIRRWSVMPRGGHFAAMEQPDVLAAEIRELCAPYAERAAARAGRSLADCVRLDMGFRSPYQALSKRNRRKVGRSGSRTGGAYWSAVLAVREAVQLARGIWLRAPGVVGNPPATY